MSLCLGSENFKLQLRQLEPQEQPQEEENSGVSDHIHCSYRRESVSSSFPPNGRGRTEESAGYNGTAVPTSPTWRRN